MHSAQMQAAVLEGCRFGRPTSDSRSLAFIRGSQNVAVTCTLSVRRAGGFLLTVKCRGIIATIARPNSRSASGFGRFTSGDPDDLAELDRI
jgi:hypothetical protein